VGVESSATGSVTSLRGTDPAGLLKTPSGLVNSDPFPGDVAGKTHIETGREGAVIGTGVRSTPLRQVAFVCPHCGVDREGAVVERRRWLLVGDTAVLPLRRVGPMVECAVCAEQCGLTVLNVPTSSALEAMLHTALRHAIVSVVRSGRSIGSTNDDVDRQAVTVMRNAGYLYDRFDLDEDLRTLSDAGTAPHLRPLADELTHHGKQSLLHRLHTLATVDGPVRPAQREVLLRIGVALGMSAAHINGVLAVSDIEASST
jgi:hypothetical protein